jgi:hypothetical protein
MQEIQPNVTVQLAKNRILMETVFALLQLKLGISTNNHVNAQVDQVTNNLERIQSDVNALAMTTSIIQMIQDYAKLKESYHLHLFTVMTIRSRVCQQELTILEETLSFNF